MKMRKKSLFFTTLAMVVLLVAALSTATFAWFTAQDTATAEGGNFATASTTAANIALKWGAEGNAQSSITLNGTTGLRPMVPTAAPKSNSSGTITFNEGTLSLNADGAQYFNADAGGATPWTNSETLTIINLDTDAAHVFKITPTVESVIATVTSEDEGSYNSSSYLELAENSFRLALFVNNSTEEGSEWTYLGTHVKGGTARYGTPLANQLLSTFNDLEQTIESGFATFNLPGARSYGLKAYAWLEGGDFDSRYQNITVTFNIKFVAGAV